MIKRIVKLSAPWCAPCKVFAKTFEKVSKNEKYKDIEFSELDIDDDDEAQNLVDKYKVRSVPTTLLINQSGELITAINGNIPEIDFTNIIDKAL